MTPHLTLYADPEADLAKIKSVWNACIPRPHFFTWNTSRRLNAIATLRVHTIDRILAGIAIYGRSAWQKKNRWMIFDNWIIEPMATIWIDKAREEAEAKAARQPPKDERVRRRTEAIAEVQRVRSEREEDNARYDALPADVQAALLTEAAADLNAAGKGRKMLARADIYVVKQRALTILKAKETT